MKMRIISVLCVLAILATSVCTTFAAITKHATENYIELVLSEESRDADIVFVEEKISEDCIKTDIDRAFKSGDFQMLLNSLENYASVENCSTKAASTIQSLDSTPGIDKDDAIYLLMHCFFSEDYPVSQNVDFDKSGKVDKDDAIYLLMYCFFPGDYPIEDKKPDPTPDPTPDDGWTKDY